jgi:hypothetical protein
MNITIARYYLVLGLALLCLDRPGVLSAAEKKKKKGSTRPAPARSITAKGTILSRERVGIKPWRLVGKKGKVYDGDMLVGLPGATLVSANKAVRLLFLADLDRNSPYPIREAGLMVHKNPDVDLDVTLDRGRIDLINNKKKGSAHVRLHVRKDTLDLILDDPGTTIGLELYSRWPAGVPFKPEPGPKDVPTANMDFIVLKGEVHLRYKDTEHDLTAPPGPALIEWDSVTGLDDTPQKLEKLPPWAQTGGKQSKLAKMKKQMIDNFRKRMLAKGLDATVQEYVNSDDANKRRLAVLVMGATDNLLGLGMTLRNAKHPDLWENGVMVLRNWINRNPGHDQLLFKAFVDFSKAPVVEAETVLQLLHSFGEDELARPEVYQTLIDYLEHDRLAIRGLAYWHLIRLVPQGKDFDFNPVDPKKDRDAAVAKWRKLIPDGKMPPKPGEEKEAKKPAGDVRKS